MSPNELAQLFDAEQGGCLSTFAAKIRIGYALSMFGSTSKTDLLLISRIRNVFAHSLHDVNFENEHIEQDVDGFGIIKNLTDQGMSFRDQTCIDKWVFEILYLYCGISGIPFLDKFGGVMIKDASGLV
jgi:hypothetical protein